MILVKRSKCISNLSWYNSLFLLHKNTQCMQKILYLYETHNVCKNIIPMCNIQCIQKYYAYVKHPMNAKIIYLCETHNVCKNIIPMWNTQCMQNIIPMWNTQCMQKYNTYVKHTMYAKNIIPMWNIQCMQFNETWFILVHTLSTPYHPL